MECIFKNKFRLFLIIGLISSVIWVIGWAVELDSGGSGLHDIRDAAYMILGGIFTQIFASLLYKELTRKD